MFSLNYFLLFFYLINQRLDACSPFLVYSVFTRTNDTSKNPLKYLGPLKIRGKSVFRVDVIKKKRLDSKKIRWGRKQKYNLY